MRRILSGVIVHPQIWADRVERCHNSFEIDFLFPGRTGNCLTRLSGLRAGQRAIAPIAHVWITLALSFKEPFPPCPLGILLVANLQPLRLLLQVGPNLCFATMPSRSFSQAIRKRLSPSCSWSQYRTCSLPVGRIERRRCLR